MDFNAALIKRRLVEQLGPAETAAEEPLAQAPQTVDLAPLLAIADDAGFVRESYQRVLGRECDVGGFVHYRELLRNHYPRRSVILQLVESVEAKATGRRYIGLWERSQENLPLRGTRWIAAVKLSIWNRARRLFEFFLRVSRVEAVELKLDYLLQEGAVQSDRSLARLDHTLFTISDKVDRYVADLVVKQGELAAMMKESGGLAEARAGYTAAALTRLREEDQATIGELGRLRAEHQAAMEALQQQHAAAMAELGKMRAEHLAAGEALQQKYGEYDGAFGRMVAELEATKAALAEVKQGQRSTVFQAGPDVIATEVDGFVLGIPAQEWRLAAYYALRGLPEPGMTKLFASFVEPGMVVADVGAHIGIYTLEALRKLSGHGMVHAFEPTPKTFALLKDNVQVNGFLESGTIELHATAVGAESGSAQFTAYTANSGHNTFYAGDAPGETLTVPVTTLDEALTGQVDIVKIDAEGAEYPILLGMRGVIERNPGIRIFVEFAPVHLHRADMEPLQWWEAVAALGLRVQRVDDVSGELLPVSVDELVHCVSWNLLLTR